jgi:mannose-6-phosphate isomerase-like protein (cupin superfamily)
MTMKRVVAGVNDAGRSYVVSIEELDGSNPLTVWDYEPDQVLDSLRAIDSTVAANWIGPQKSGGARWIFAPLKPQAEQGDNPVMEGIDKDGFHTTRTVDFDIILEGELTIVFDEDRVQLRKGDFVILQGAKHAWKNESDKTAILLALLHRPEGV